LSLPLDLLKEIIQFYDQVQTVEMVTQSIEKEAFLQISNKGREFLVRRIFSESADAKQSSVKNSQRTDSVDYCPVLSDFHSPVSAALVLFSGELP
jgi:ABC-type lipoprotein release transport system permease subunit